MKGSISWISKKKKIRNVRNSIFKLEKVNETFKEKEIIFFKKTKTLYEKEKKFGALKRQDIIIHDTGIFFIKAF